LGDSSETTRAAAAEALGKLRATAAVDPIMKRLPGAKGEERSASLAALSDIGDARAEVALVQALETAVPGEKARIMAGLGRIASLASIQKLIAEFRHGDDKVRESALSGLTLAKDRALEYVVDPALRLQIAARFQSPQSDAAIRSSMSDSLLTKAAIKAARGREGLVDAVWPLEGEVDNVPMRIEVLASTKAGRRILDSLRDHPTYGGFARRALELSTISEN
jgi:HEAT repeat protein